MSTVPLYTGDVVRAPSGDGVVLSVGGGVARVQGESAAVEVPIAQLSLVHRRPRLRLDPGVDYRGLADLKGLKAGSRVMFVRAFGVAQVPPHPLDENWPGVIAGENATVVGISERKLTVTLVVDREPGSPFQLDERYANHLIAVS